MWRSLLLIALLLTGCSADYDSMAKQRLTYARNSLSDIHIAAVQDTQDSAYINGILLAAEEINKRVGKLIGRKLKIDIEQSADGLEANKAVIRRIASNPQITAVLGHRKSSVAIPAAVIYERSHVVFMPPFATADRLTSYYFDYVFRMVPSNSIAAEQIASVAKTLGYQKLVLLYSREDISRELAFLVENAALAQGIEVISRLSFFEKNDNHRTVIAEFSNKEFDAVFVGASSVPSGVMVKQLREMGVQQPILGSDAMNASEYLETAGAGAENTIVPDIYPPTKNISRFQKFIERYKDKYGETPDYNAAQGYDSLMLLAHGIEKAESTIPSRLSSALHYMPAWVGITGLHAFTEKGELLGKKYFFKAFQEGRWKPMPAIETPYTLERFQRYLKLKGKGNSVDYGQVFAKRMHDDEHDSLLLELAQEILKIKRIGVIYEDTKEGRDIASYALLDALEKSEKIQVIPCKIPFSLLDKDSAEKAVVGCYGTLALSIDALFVTPYDSLDTKLLEQLNSNLQFFKIPTLSLNDRNTDPNITLVLTKRSDINLRGTGAMKVYGELLKNLKVHEFSGRLKNLPEIGVNLTSMQDYELSDEPILMLSPDNYME